MLLRVCLTVLLMLAAGAQSSHSAGDSIAAAPAAALDETSCMPGGLLEGLSAGGWESCALELFHARGGKLLDGAGHEAGRAGDASADLLLEFGCTGAAVKNFRRGQRLCTVAAYEFDSDEGAYGAYSNLRVGASTVLIRGDASSEDDDSISFWKGRYFISLSTSAKEDDEAKETLTGLANSISTRLAVPTFHDRPQIRLLAKLPVLERISGSERYYRGPIAAKLHVCLPYLSLLSLNKCCGSISADYQYPQPYSERLRLLLIEYFDERQAKATFNAYNQAVAANHKVVESNDGQTLFKLNDSYMLCRQSGSFVALISGARKRYAPGMLARQMLNQAGNR